MQSSQAVGFVSRLAATGVFVLAALSLAHGAKPPANPALKPPFEITEDRPRCSNYNPKRHALFGTTHLHTGLSFDASIRFVDYANGNDPRGAYLFAQGKAPISIPEPSGLQPRRRALLQRPGDRAHRRRRSEPYALHRRAAQLGRRDRPLRALRRDGLLQEPRRQVPVREHVDGVPDAQRLLLRAAARPEPGPRQDPRLQRVHPAHHHEPRRDQQEHQPPGVQQQPGSVRQGRDGGMERGPAGRRGGLRPHQRMQLHQLRGL